MSAKKLVVNARIVNEGQVVPGSVLIENDLIAEVFTHTGAEGFSNEEVEIIDAQNSFLIPGIIDDQVHFREPGLTHKANILSESRAAVAGGITSFMEMPNTIPQATSMQLLDDKYDIGANRSMANYSFYMGATNDNLEELQKIQPDKVCGIKVFMGSSTGNMLVNDEESLDKIFSQAKTLVATHCEDEATIKANMEEFAGKFGTNILPEHHPLIRSHQACFLSSRKAVALARKHNTRLHVLHLSTAQETGLFESDIDLREKKITGEVCVHHLWFSDQDYAQKGNFIKWNPAVKGINDREKLWQSLLDGTLDVVATDHAPHLAEEKQQPYLQAPSGGPLVQHSLQAMFDALQARQLPIHLLVQWMCHNPAIAYKVSRRGFIRKGYYADLTLLNPSKLYTVNKANILYKCGWSPFEGHTFNATPTHTIINGELVYRNGEFAENFRGRRLEFDRS